MTETEQGGDDRGLLLIRPSDLATVRLGFTDLELSGRIARRVDGGGFEVTLELPPQHFREHPGAPMDDVLDLAAAAPTVLLFSASEQVSSEGDDIDLGDEGLLGLCERLMAVFDSTVAVPARARLAPLNASWHMGSQPEVLNGRGSLWRAKLAGPVVGGVIRARLQLADVQDADEPPWDVLPSSADLRERVGGTLEASRLDFSPIGATARLRGPVDFGLNVPTPPDREHLIGSYEHDIDVGRDSRVRVVSRGHLSSGHPATLTRVARRIFIGGSPDTGFAQEQAVAFLERQASITVDDPVLDVDALADAYGGPARDMPFRRLRLLTTYVDVDDVLADQAGLEPFWVSFGGEDVQFVLQGTDHAGNVVPFAVPLLFIPGETRFDPGRLAEVFGTGGPERRSASVGSASIALVAPETPEARAVAPLTVEAVELGVQHVDPVISGASGSPVLPVLSGLRVVVDAAAHFSGVRRAVDAVWHQAYRDSGLDRAANELGSYLQLPEALPVDFGDPRRIGGLATPNMQVAALSVLKGAIPRGLDPRQALSPADFARQFGSAKILGVIPLSEIVDLEQLRRSASDELKGSIPVELRDRYMPPGLEERITRESAQLSYTFAAPIASQGDSVLRPAGPAAGITLSATVVRRFADGATTTTISGVVKDIEISLLEIVVLRFATLRFAAQPGRKTTFEQAGLNLRFGGDLTFLQELSDEVGKALADLGIGGTTIRVGTDGISAGFAMTLPELSMGMFSLTNLSVGALLTVPFDSRPLEFTLAVGERFKPFSVMVSLFTGGGFLALTMTSAGLQRVEASIEFGGSMQLNLVVASGGLSVMAGIYFRLDPGGNVTLGGYLRASGQVTVLGILTISADFFMQLSYVSATKEAVGQASLTIGVKLLFFSKSVTLSVERRFSAITGDPTFTDCYDPEDWAAYCDAFA
jgi:hypothetical protein